MNDEARRVGSPMFWRAIGPGSVCRSCAHLGRVLTSTGQTVVKVLIQAKGGGLFQACPVCDQHELAAPAWRWA